MTWPNKKWGPGIIDEDGRQLWYSRLVTKEDRTRRREYEAKYDERERLRRESGQ